MEIKSSSVGLKRVCHKSDKNYGLAVQNVLKLILDAKTGIEASRLVDSISTDLKIRLTFIDLEAILNDIDWSKHTIDALIMDYDIDVEIAEENYRKTYEIGQKLFHLEEKKRMRIELQNRINGLYWYTKRLQHERFPWKKIDKIRHWYLFYRNRKKFIIVEKYIDNVGLFLKDGRYHASHNWK